MPTIKLQWGLWNQMFQYALAFTLSKEQNEAIVMDGYFLENRFVWADWTFRHYELEVFGIKKIYTLQHSFFRRFLHPIFTYLIRKIQKGELYIKEEQGRFISIFPQWAYLDGWFQSYKYFEKHKDDLREILTVKTPISQKNQEILDLISSVGKGSVSLHVRRWDYVSLDAASKWHGVCSIGYYESAIVSMKNTIENPTFFVFSDDIEWCKQNIIFPAWTNAHYIDHNGSAGHEDMRLMYSCAHHIIANSSFSWWWAYLWRNPDKSIIAPKKWLQVDTFDTQNLIPPSWTLL